jgi:hypothetical protein
MTTGEVGASVEKRQAARAMMWVVFLLLFVFSYSEEIVGLLYDLLGFGAHDGWRTSPGWRMGVVAIEAVVLVVVALQRRTICRIDGTPSRMWRLWWSGCVAVIVLDVALSELPFRPTTWVLVATAVVFALLMGTLLATALNADPRTLFSVDRRRALPADWRRVRAIVPLVLGTFGAFLAAIGYHRALNLDSVRALPAEIAAQLPGLSVVEQLETLEIACENAIASEYFQQVVGVIPLLLLTLGVEFGYFRKSLRDPAQRATTAATVAVMSVALVLALSTLPFEGQGCNDMLSDWHEFLTFVVTVQGIAIGLVTLVWLLVSGTADDD